MTDSAGTLSTPDPTWQALIFTLLRQVLVGLGAVGVTLPAWASNASGLWSLAGALAVIAGMVWGLVEKYQAARAQHAAAVASAATGVAVKA